MIGTFIDTPFPWSKVEFEGTLAAIQGNGQSSQSTCEGTLLLGLAEFKKEYNCPFGLENTEQSYYLDSACEDSFEQTTCEVCIVGGLISIGFLLIALVVSLMALGAIMARDDEDDSPQKAVKSNVMTFVVFLLTGGSFAVWRVTCRENIQEELNPLTVTSEPFGDREITFDWGAICAMAAAATSLLAFICELFRARGWVKLRCSIHKSFSFAFIILTVIGAGAAVVAGSFATRLAWSTAALSFASTVDPSLDFNFVGGEDCQIDTTLGLAEIRQKVICDSGDDTPDIDVFYWQSACKEDLIANNGQELDDLCSVCMQSGFVSIGLMAIASLIALTVLFKVLLMENHRWSKVSVTTNLCFVALFAAASWAQWIARCQRQLQSYVDDLSSLPFLDDSGELLVHVGVIIAIGVMALSLVSLVLENMRESDSERAKRLEEARMARELAEAADLENPKGETENGDDNLKKKDRKHEVVKGGGEQKERAGRRRRRRGRRPGPVRTSL
mmetsp:Transcript_45806/g.76301  ORF Transcript_45806/g.76301 Transcript_45806/m.76301 type:complete len:501 (-) Transcript_45806:302-1804(-)